MAVSKAEVEEAPVSRERLRELHDYGECHIRLDHSHRASGADRDAVEPILRYKCEASRSWSVSGVSS